MKSKLTADPDLARFLAKSAAFSAYGLGSMTALGTIGIDTAPLLTGIGITGFTIGFALKEITTNFLSGVMLVFGKPFRKGQWLKVLGPSGQQQLEGEVQSIDARYVLLRTKDRGVVMIPSVVVYTNPILVSGNGISSSAAAAAAKATSDASAPKEETK
jgi:small-conductance mechanosensitive channel